MSSEFLGAIGFGLVAAFMIWMADRRGFFNFAPLNTKWLLPIRWYHVIAAFGVYFVTIGVGVPILITFLKPALSNAPHIALASWLNFLTSFSIFVFLTLYLCTLKREVSSKIWRRSETSAYSKDIGWALFAWLVSFPIVICLNQVFDLLIYFVFHVQHLPDQIAVRFLKMTFEEPRYFLMTIVTIVVLAPIIEETLFRGFLQSFIRQHLGSRSAIFITALCFSFFHYSPEQGVSNISIVGSLFGLALFLGYIYERQGSLLASMTLHATFNAVSVLNLYFLGGFPKGPL